MSLKLESPDKQVVQVIMKKPVSAQPFSGERGLDKTDARRSGWPTKSEAVLRARSRQRWWECLGASGTLAPLWSPLPCVLV